MKNTLPSFCPLFQKRKLLPSHPRVLCHEVAFRTNQSSVVRTNMVFETSQYRVQPERLKLRPLLTQIWFILVSLIGLVACSTLLIALCVDHVDEPLPRIDIGAIANADAHRFMPNPCESTITVDVMHIAKSTATSISKDTHVFYDTEILAVIHRYKSKSSGLVSTKVWSWQGKRSRCGEKEDRKLQELAKRYGATLVILQCIKEEYLSHDITTGMGASVSGAARTGSLSWGHACHPTGEAQAFSFLGASLTGVYIQGIRAHWSSENTAMHSVRAYNGLIFIEEHDLVGLPNPVIDVGLADQESTERHKYVLRLQLLFDNIRHPLCLVWVRLQTRGTRSSIEVCTRPCC
jgi:hypothetical protein